MIPRYDPTYTFRDLWTSLRMCSSGDSGKELCARLRDVYEAKHTFLFDHARTALFAVLRAYDRPGDVLTPAYNCIVVPEAVQCAGYRPVFVDIGQRSLNVTREAFARSRTPRTTVVLATHLFGIPCDIEDVVAFGRENDLLVVEDAAAAIGAEFRGRKVGRFGDASIISFQATKVISGEDGGALLTNDDRLAERVGRLLEAARSPAPNTLYFVRAIARKIALRRWIYPLVLLGSRLLGKECRYEVVSPKRGDPGRFLRRCSPFLSALGEVQMARLPGNLERRRELAEIYASGLVDHPDIMLTETVGQGAPSWIQFPILVEDKRRFYQHMRKRRVDMSWTYRYSCAASFGKDGFPGAERAARTVLGLPTYPSLTNDEARRICREAREYSRADGQSRGMSPRRGPGEAP